MEKYRRNLKRTMAFCGVAAAVLIGWMLVERLMPGVELTVAGSYRAGFCCGAAGALVVYMIYVGRLLRSEEKLREKYTREMDERMVAIRAKAGMPMLLYTSVVIMLASVGMSYVNDTVFKTLYVVGMVQLVFGVVAKVYYTKTM